MKSLSILSCVFVLSFIIASVSVAGDFDWIKDFNIKGKKKRTRKRKNK